MMGQFKLDKAKKVTGWMSDEELSYLAEISSNCKTIYEVGSFCGKSARAMADNSPSNCKIYCVDPWSFIIYNTDGTVIKIDETTFTEFHRFLNDHIKSGKVIPCPMTWKSFSVGDKDLADFIFIDGDHTYDAVKYDIDKALHSVNCHGIIAGHDYDWKDVQKAVSEFFPKRDLKIRGTIWSVYLK